MRGDHDKYAGNVRILFRKMQYGDRWIMPVVPPQRKGSLAATHPACTTNPGAARKGVIVSRPSHREGALRPIPPPPEPPPLIDSWAQNPNAVFAAPHLSMAWTCDELKQLGRDERRRVTEFVTEFREPLSKGMWSIFIINRPGISNMYSSFIEHETNAPLYIRSAYVRAKSVIQRSNKCNSILVPLLLQTVGNQQNVNAPEYLNTDLAGLTWTCIPYGCEPIALLSLATPNAALSSESDVYTFSSDLTTISQQSDIDALTAYCGPLNLSTAALTAGMAFTDIVTAIATQMLALQAICGALNITTSIFSDGVTTLDTAISGSSIASLTGAQTATLSGSAGASLGAGAGTGAGAGAGAGNSGNAQPVSSNGPFSFEGYKPPIRSQIR
jgi:hypothetical protein